MKKFSIITVFGSTEEEDEEIFLPGFCEIDDLVHCDVLFEIMSEIPSSETADIEIEHCYLLDTPYVDEELNGKMYAGDISDEDIGFLLDNFDSLVEEDKIFCEDTINFELDGLYEDEVYVEEVVSFDD